MSNAPAIVIATTSYPMRGDGSEAAGAFVADLVESLAGHVPVRVVAPGMATVVESQRGGVQVYRFAAPDKPLSNLKPWRPADALQIMRVLRGGMQALDAAVAAGQTAHILALWALPTGYWARRVARRYSVPYSVWTLGSDIWSLGRVPLLRRQLVRVLREASHCYSDGLLLGTDAQALSGREVEFLPSTRRIDARRTAPMKAEPPYRLLFLGRWHHNKGVDLLLQALAQLGEGDWARISEVVVCGGGPLESQVRDGVASLQAAGRPVALRGFLDKAAAVDAFLAADYLLIPSRIESIPVVFSDAMKLGTPVVAMPVGDLPELIGGKHECGILAGSVSASAFAQALGKALADAPLKFSEGLALQAQRFDVENLAQRVVDQLAGPARDDTPRWGNQFRDRKADAIWSTMEQMLGPGIADGQWLDVGCGSGGIARALARRVVGMTGVDPEAWPEWGTAASEVGNLDFHIAACDGPDLPVPKRSIDVVVCNQVYEHVGDPRQLVRNIAAVLKPGGHCYFAGPNLLWPVEPHVNWPFVHWLPRGFAQKGMCALGSSRAGELDAFSTHYWQLTRWFKEAGLEFRSVISERFRAEFITRQWPTRWLPRWTDPLSRPFAAASPGFVFLLCRPVEHG